MPDQYRWGAGAHPEGVTDGDGHAAVGAGRSDPHRAGDPHRQTGGVPPVQPDPYLVTSGAAVMCVPMFKQARLVGVLYLENRLMPEVFTAEHSRVVSLLGAQAAVSLETAALRRAAGGKHPAPTGGERAARQPDLTDAGRADQPYRQLALGAGAGSDVYV